MLVAAVGACNALSGVGDYREIDCPGCADGAPPFEAGPDGVSPEVADSASSPTPVATATLPWQIVGVNFHLDRPIAVQPGDLMIVALLFGEDASSNLAGPAGWNMTGTTGKFGPEAGGFYWSLVWYDRIAAEGEPSSIEFSQSASSSVNAEAAFVAYRGVSFFDHEQQSDAGCNVDLPTVTLAKPNAAILVAAMTWPPDSHLLAWTQPTGMSAAVGGPRDPVQIFSTWASSGGSFPSPHVECNGPSYVGALLYALYP
jgi:hypothetical protein